MPHDPYGALYVHIPFCASRCAYCDFTTHAVAPDDPRIDEYLEHLILDIRRKTKEGELGAVKTAYIGGGTPSFLGISRLSSLMYMLSLSVHMPDDFEMTMEANPDSLDERMVKDIWAMGVNRLSIGVQSFDDEILRILGRRHDAQTAREAIACARDRFENVSVDLMCGIPGQSAESFQASLEEAVGLGVTHVSVYPLTVEQNTPLYKRALAGDFPWPDDDVEADHMELAERVLTLAGFERYEVASYARPGYACRHNIAYWTGVPYIGFGEGAATMTQNDERRMRMQDGVVTDDLNRAQREAEDIMLGMRMARGVSDERVAQAEKYVEGLPACLEELVEMGLVEHSDNRWKPTRSGWLCGNELYGRIFDLA